MKKKNSTEWSQIYPGEKSVFLMDQYTKIEQILWFFLKHWHGCQHCCAHLKLWFHPKFRVCSLCGLQTATQPEIVIFQHLLEDFFFFPYLIFLYLSSSMHPSGSSSTLPGFVMEPKLLSSKKLLLLGEERCCFLQIKLILGTFCGFLYENEPCNCCNYLSQHGEGE